MSRLAPRLACWAGLEGDDGLTTGSRWIDRRWFNTRFIGPKTFTNLHPTLEDPIPNLPKPERGPVTWRGRETGKETSSEETKIQILEHERGLPGWYLVVGWYSVPCGLDPGLLQAPQGRCSHPRMVHCPAEFSFDLLDLVNIKPLPLLFLLQTITMYGPTVWVTIPSTPLSPLCWAGFPTVLG